MPNRASAAKSHRQSEQNRLRNKARISELKTLGKQIDRKVQDKDPAGASTLLRRYAKRVDQACAVGVLHRNTAARRKSRMAHLVATLAAAPA